MDLTQKIAELERRIQHLECTIRVLEWENEQKHKDAWNEIKDFRGKELPSTRIYNAIGLICHKLYVPKGGEVIRHK